MDHVDAALATRGLETMVGGASVSVFGYILSSGPAALIGAAVAILGLVITCFFGWRRDQRDRRQELREQAEHEARMRALS